MSVILEQISDPVGWLVLAGGALQSSAHLFKNQIVLRLMLLAGTAHYLGYYFAVAEQPLWPAILATSTITLGSLIGLLRVLVWRRREHRLMVAATTGALGRGHAELRVVENHAKMT